MSTSSARPDDLDAFATKSRGADDDLRARLERLMAVYDEFQDGTSWGRFDAHSLLSGFGKYIDWNEVDAAWVARIAATFRHAGGSGSIALLPDAAIQASLRAAGLDGDRRSVTFDDPVAFGFPPTTGYADDPVNTASGNFVALESDLSFTGLVDGLRFARTYNSRSDRVGSFGQGWSSWATARLRPRPDGVEYEGPDGQRALFPRMGAGYGRVVGVNALVEPLASGLALRWFGGGWWEFDAAGRPVRVERGPGTEVRFRHDDDGRLVELSHAGGKRMSLDWDGERITAVGCSDGRHVSYGYDSASNLVEVDGSAGTRRYKVDDDGRVASVTDADGVVEVVNSYDDGGRVLEQLSPFGRRTLFGYLPGRVTVTSGGGEGPTNTYIHDQAGRVLAIVDGNDERLAINYDERGNPVAVTERNGAVTVQAWDDRARLLRRVLPTGVAFTFSYDDADRVVEVAASTGEVTRHSYTGDERSPVEVADPEGGITRLTVESGLVRRVVDPDGVELGFEFDSDGNLIAATDGDGHVARLERDEAGRVSAAVTPLGRRTMFLYDGRGQPVERHDPTGAVWRYEYTPAGRLTSVTDPTGAREEIRYGEHGNQAAAVDALGHATTQRYDIFGNVVGVVAPDGATWEYSYDALARLTAIADPAGATWQREYDANGNLIASTDPAGTRCTATLDPAGRVSALDDGLTSSTFEFDVLGRCLAHRRPDGTEARAGYDRCGRRTTIEDPSGGITRVEYTPAGRVQREISPSGRVDGYEYDRCGRLAARTDGAGRRWEYRYDPDGALVERVAPTGETERFTYDRGGRLTDWSAPGQGVTSYAYDPAGRVVEITDRVAGTRRFGYDAVGRLVAATDANGATTRYSYNERGWLTEIVDPLGGTVTRGYDEVGRLVSEIDPLGRTTTLAYDAAGRLTERLDGSGRKIRWSHDASGRVRSFGPADQTPITIERDALGREVAIDEPGSFAHRLRWDEAGRLVERRRGEHALRWAYNEDGERSALGYPDGTETTYAHDAGGLLAGLQHPALGTVDLERDPSGRLTGATGEGMRARWSYEAGELTEYDIDAGGKHHATQLTRDALGRVASATVDGGLHRFSYDAAGQLLSADTLASLFSFSYDANGRLEREASAAGIVDYEYDAAGQLVSRERPATAVTHYEYDGAGRRLREVEAEFSRSYRWDELGRLAGIDSSGRGDGDDRSTGLAVDALGELAEVDGTPLLWDTADPLTPLTWMGGQAVIGHGSPWALARDDEADWLAPDWQGTIGEVARDPWGAAASAAPDAPAGASLRLGYRGELELDGETWLRNRVYDPGSRSFLGPDPRPPVPGTACAANPYHYAANNPIGLSDPLGLRPVTDAQLQQYRDQMGRNIFERSADFAADNWEYVAAGAMVVGGVALMATGVGGPAGIALAAAGGGLVSAGASAGIQKLTTGDVNWGQVAVAGAVGGFAGGLGAGAGMFVGSLPRLATVSPWVHGAVVGGTEGVVGGAANRGLQGQDPLNPGGMAVDLLTGGSAGAVGGRLGGQTQRINPKVVRFSQDSVGSGFRDGGSIDELVAGLRSGDIRPGDVPPIRVLRRDGDLYTLDNRRLEAFRQADKHIRFRVATPEEVARESYKFTTKDRGQSIRIRGND